MIDCGPRTWWAYCPIQKEPYHVVDWLQPKYYWDESLMISLVIALATAVLLAILRYRHWHYWYDPKWADPANDY